MQDLTPGPEKVEVKTPQEQGCGHHGHLAPIGYPGSQHFLMLLRAQFTL